MYKNGVFHSDVDLYGINGSIPVITKTFTATAGSQQVAYNLNSYFFNCEAMFYQDANNTVGAVDTYVVYAILNFTLTSTQANIGYIGNSPFTYGWITNPSVSTSYFLNFAYTAGSSNTTGYVNYLQKEDLVINHSKYSTDVDGYSPIGDPETWSGIYQLQNLYTHKLLVGGGDITFQQTSTNISSFNDGAAGVTQGLFCYNAPEINNGDNICAVFASNLSNSFQFSISPQLTNGVIFQEQGSTLFRVYAKQPSINYNKTAGAGGSVVILTLPSNGTFIYTFAQNTQNNNIISFCFVSGGAGFINDCFVYNKNLGLSGYGTIIIGCTSNQFIISGNYPVQYTKFDVRIVKVSQ